MLADQPTISAPAYYSPGHVPTTRTLARLFHAGGDRKRAARLRLKRPAHRGQVRLSAPRIAKKSRSAEVAVQSAQSAQF